MSVSLSGSWLVVEIVRADGFVATDIRPLVRLNVSIVAKQGDRRETGSFGLGGRYLYDQLFDPTTWNRALWRSGVVRCRNHWKFFWLFWIDLLVPSYQFEAFF